MKKCLICKGTKKSKYIDLEELSYKLKDNKSYDLNLLLKKYGHESNCPDCVLMN